MKTSWGVGIIVAILLSAAVFSFGVLDFAKSFSLMLLLVGGWTLVAAFALEEEKDRSYYSAWGVVLAVMSLFAYLPAGYSIGLVFLAIIALILINLYWGRTGKVVAAASGASRPAGGTPAANAF